MHDTNVENVFRDSGNTKDFEEKRLVLVHAWLKDRL